MLNFIIREHLLGCYRVTLYFANRAIAFFAYNRNLYLTFCQSVISLSHPLD
ncbi:hypothetical protein [Funiculus sociatus]|uniref:hypothetical protein n=1 Tax=Funiculus sociatus TaxID=450527 RepID=UPI003297693B